MKKEIYRVKVKYPDSPFVKGGKIYYNEKTGKWHHIIGSSNLNTPIFESIGIMQPYNYPDIFEKI